MWKAIVKYSTMYRIIFKKDKDNLNDEVSSPIIISAESYNEVKKALINNKWFEINEELYNPFFVACVRKIKVEDWIDVLISSQDPDVSEKLREYIRLDKNTLTLSRVQNMIAKAKEELKKQS